MASFNGVGKSGNAEFTVKKSIEFYRSPLNSFRAQISEIGGKPYVGLVKFWKTVGIDEFVPTRKSIFMNPKQWRALGQQAKNVNFEIGTFAGAGMNSI